MSDKVKNFKEYLDNKNCFKLICGAGNKDYEAITKLCALYAQAGCRFFDINASVEAVRAAKKGIAHAGKEDDCFICVSVGTKDDPHLSKYKINPDSCINCGSCTSVCIQNAIKSSAPYSINENLCIGCGKCQTFCSKQSIEQYFKCISFAEILPDIIDEGIDCIEYHTITDDENEVISGWKTINNMYKGALSVCINRSKTSDEKIKDRLNKMKSTDRIFIVQADGAPMSGGKDDFNTTLQAVSMADFAAKTNITPYIFVSGGTNSHTSKLLRMNNIDITGIAVGSFARKIVKKYTDTEDFLTNKAVFNDALKIAKQLIENCKTV